MSIISPKAAFQCLCRPCWLLSFSVVIFVHAFIVSQPVLANSSPVGKAYEIKGQVMAVNAGQARAIKNTADIFQGDEIASDTNSSARIDFKDGSSLAIGPESVLKIGDFVDAEGATLKQNLRLNSGVFRFASGRIINRDASALKIETPLCFVGIRGTEIGITLAAPVDYPAQLHNAIEEVRLALRGNHKTVSGPPAERLSMFINNAVPTGGYVVHSFGLDRRPVLVSTITNELVATLLVGEMIRLPLAGSTVEPFPSPLDPETTPFFRDDSYFPHDPNRAREKPKGGRGGGRGSSSS